MFFFRGNFSGLQFPDPDPLVEMARISLQQRWSEPLWFGPLWIDAILAALAEATDAVGGVTRDGWRDGWRWRAGRKSENPSVLCGNLGHVRLFLGVVLKEKSKKKQIQ